MAASPLFAQTNVYSVNAVGYVQTVLNPGIYQLIANPLNTTNNSLGSLFPTMPNNTVVAKWNGTGYASSTFRFGAWGDPTLTLNPGEACFIKLGGAASITNTFVGEVLQGSLTNVLGIGYTMASSKVPQAGGIQTQLGLVPNNNEIMVQWDQVNQTYISHTFRFGAWGGGEPTVAVGEGFFYSSANGNTWTRTFSVNN
jgi:hypothetical protein